MGLEAKPIDMPAIEWHGSFCVRLKPVRFIEV